MVTERLVVAMATAKQVAAMARVREVEKWVAVKLAAVKLAAVKPAAVKLAAKLVASQAPVLRDKLVLLHDKLLLPHDKLELLWRASLVSRWQCRASVLDRAERHRSDTDILLPPAPRPDRDSLQNLLRGSPCHSARRLDTGRQHPLPSRLSARLPAPLPAPLPARCPARLAARLPTWAIW